MLEKITEKFLLERASPKAKTLEQIKTLNLSQLGLKCKDLPVKLLCRLQALEAWDLCGNMLEELPRGLALPRLRSLDLSDNEMEDVTTLDSLTSLEELKLEGNIYITVSDNYKLMVLLPKLKMYNGKDISSIADHVRHTSSNILNTKVVDVWDTKFGLSDAITPEKVANMETEFVTAAQCSIRYGPNSIKDYTRWRVGVLAKEYLRSLLQRNEEGDESQEPTNAKENNRKQAPAPSDDPCLTPRKRARGDSCASPAPGLPRLTPQKTGPPSVAVRASPRKAAAAQLAASCPVRVTTPRKGLAETPREEGGRPKRRATADQGHAASTPTPREAEASPRKRSCFRAQVSLRVVGICVFCRGNVNNKLKLPTSEGGERVRLKPLHVLQCHSKQDSPKDFSTQLWACAFMPPPHGSKDTSGGRLAATCGGDSICLIDCETGLVMKKYKVPGEEFFTLGWSTVLMSRANSAPVRPCSILAAGGKRGLVKLMYPLANVAYGEFRASRKAMSTLQFSPRQGNHLFTGAYDNKITLWDIGGIDSQYNFKVSQLMVFECGSTPLHLRMPPASPDTLLAATESGLHSFNTAQLHTGATMKRTPAMEITFPVYEQEDKDHNYHTIDGLSFLTDDIVASKSHLQPSIYLWSWGETLRQPRDKRSRGVAAVLLAELQWATTDVPYLALSTCPEKAYLVCGDDSGKLWTYSLHNLLPANTHQRGELVPPTEVLEWPAPLTKASSPVAVPSINSVAMGPGLSYLVALSDKNMVVVWKREDSS
ncbi:Leucine-rich repeat and WD repeat-containing protein 1 [Merluccius polli]|uniref:Leucine-rich repeat and WD repeat-containing protein 1 n=1 Tax=Merluccius polli TaxID=89951 RepID=A0AA47MYX8_MERPO|nr:Leucine-rich repeat and WD repeat-containing protein 1 [Merluccius polli]